MARVLIVEDEAILRMTFAEFLREDGYDVDVAVHFDDALVKLNASSFDVVVTDIVMEGKTGIDLLKVVHERFPRSSVIVITGEPNVETASQAVRLGAFDYLAKPVTGRDLKRVVRMALERMHLREERDTYAQQMDQYRRELEAIFHSVNEGIMTVDADLRIRQVNATAANLLGVPACELERKESFSVFLGELDVAQDALKRTLETRKPVAEFRVEARGQGGGARVIVMSTTPLIDANGSHAGAVLVARDVTKITQLERELEERIQYHQMIGRSRRMQEVFQLIDNVAATDSTVLIIGESGTGKELVASALHYGNARSKAPFVKVNCAALSEDLLESELFGHVKGAFTSAVRDRIGRFEAAEGGTILLDEIGDISPRLQQRLLRVLQEREFERVGDSRPIRVDVRVIASTNQDLRSKMEHGTFREDLYYRLNVVRIELPPLRERRNDIPLLVDHFCKRFNEMFKKQILGLAPEVMELFMNYQWRGNIRELENSLERAFIVCHDSVILPKHLPPEILNFKAPVQHAHATQYDSNREDGDERGRILDVLRRTDWNIAKSARMLGIARNTLYQRMKAYDLDRSQPS